MLKDNVVLINDNRYVCKNINGSLNYLCLYSPYNQTKYDNQVVTISTISGISLFIISVLILVIVIFIISFLRKKSVNYRVGISSGVTKFFSNIFSYKNLLYNLVNCRCENTPSCSFNCCKGSNEVNDTY